MDNEKNDNDALNVTLDMARILINDGPTDESAARCEAMMRSSGYDGPSLNPRAMVFTVLVSMAHFVHLAKEIDGSGELLAEVLSHTFNAEELLQALQATGEGEMLIIDPNTEEGKTLMGAVGPALQDAEMERRAQKYMDENKSEDVD